MILFTKYRSCCEVESPFWYAAWAGEIMLLSSRWVISLSCIMLSVILDSVGRMEIGLKCAASVIAPLFLYIGVMVATFKISGYVLALNVLFSNLTRGLI